MAVAAALPTRQRLLAAAREIVDAEGYGGASVVAIAARAGVASGTLYRHFASKEELFVELFRGVCDRELAAMESVADEMAAQASKVEALVEVLVTFARRALRARRLAWALLAEPVDPRVDAERLVYRRRYAALIAGLLEAATLAREIPAQDPQFVAAALVGGCAEALVGPLSAEGFDVERALSLYRAFVERAIGKP